MIAFEYQSDSVTAPNPLFGNTIVLQMPTHVKRLMSNSLLIYLRGPVRFAHHFTIQFMQIVAAETFAKWMQTHLSLKLKYTDYNGNIYYVKCVNQNFDLRNVARTVTQLDIVLEQV